MKTKEQEKFKNNHKLESLDSILDEMFGAKGTQSRLDAEEKAYAFYSCQMLEDARKQAKITQSELAEKIGTSKTYISRIENGHVEPKVSTFYRILNALGMRVDIVPA